MSNKKSIPSTTLTFNDSIQNKLTDSQIKEIYAQFNANGEELVANAPDLPNDVNKKLNTKHEQQNNFNANNHHLKTTSINQPKYDFWEEDEDEDDDDDDDTDRKQVINHQSQSVKKKQTTIMNNLDIQPVYEYKSY